MQREAEAPPMNREEWLEVVATEFLRDRLLIEHMGPNDSWPDRMRYSVGFPGGRQRTGVMGEAWDSQVSADGTCEVFVSPLYDDPVEIVSTVLHEVIHHVVGVEHGHKGPFRRLAVACGLTGKMTATYAGPELKQWIEEFLRELPPYPHAKLIPNGKKQKTRMLKLKCPRCGYTARTTKKWLESMGTPVCNCSFVPHILVSDMNIDCDWLIFDKLVRDDGLVRLELEEAM